jgi:uracil-DNA glycosylase family 4
MPRNGDILDDVIEYLEVERMMGTEWIPVTRARPGEAGAGPGPSAARPRPEPRPVPLESIPPPPPPETETAAQARGQRARSRSRLPAVEPALAGLDRTEAESRGRALEAVRAEVRRCIKCVLHERRRNTVFHEGSPAARLCFVGEGPGAEEDASGLPFVGKAGQLLTRIIEAMGLRREHVYICNTVKCRPPGNRTPLPEEMQTCWPYLEKQLEIVRPEVIVALGLPAAQMLVKGILSIGRSRGKWMEYRKTPVMITYHPAYLLRNPTAKKLVWEDMQKVHERLVQGSVRT